MECLDGTWLGQIPVCRGNEKGQSMMYSRRLLIFVGLSHCTASADVLHDDNVSEIVMTLLEKI